MRAQRCHELNGAHDTSQKANSDSQSCPDKFPEVPQNLHQQRFSLRISEGFRNTWNVFRHLWKISVKHLTMWWRTSFQLFQAEIALPRTSPVNDGLSHCHGAHENIHFSWSSGIRKHVRISVPIPKSLCMWCKHLLKESGQQIRNLKPPEEPLYLEKNSALSPLASKADFAGCDSPS